MRNFEEHSWLQAYLQCNIVIVFPAGNYNSQQDRRVSTELQMFLHFVLNASLIYVFFLLVDNGIKLGTKTA